MIHLLERAQLEHDYLLVVIPPTLSRNFLLGGWEGKEVSISLCVIVPTYPPLNTLLSALLSGVLPSLEHDTR